MSDARSAILDRLRAAPRARPLPDASALVGVAAPPGNGSLALLRERMAAVQTEWLDASKDRWPVTLAEWLRAQGIDRLACAPAAPDSATLRRAWPADGPSLWWYDAAFEQRRDALFGLAAGLCTARAAVVETGSLLLWSSPQEPRLLSLLPSLSIVVLHAGRLHATLEAAMRAEGWQQGMPTNALIISSPSRTADIEQTLVYGVHGPQRLLVLAVN